MRNLASAVSRSSAAAMQAPPPGPSVEEIWSQRHNEILKDYYANKEAARRNKVLQRGGVLPEPRIPKAFDPDHQEASKENEENSSRNNSLSERSINSGELDVLLLSFLLRNLESPSAQERTRAIEKKKSALQRLNERKSEALETSMKKPDEGGDRAVAPLHLSLDRTSSDASSGKDQNTSIYILYNIMYIRNTISFIFFYETNELINSVLDKFI